MYRNLKAMTALLVAAFIPATAFAEEHIVRVVSDYENLRMTFEPDYLVIKPGDTVTWVNDVAESHNMVTYPNGFPAATTGFVSPYLNEEGERWSMIFKAEGTYEYHCVPHIFMGMRGKIIVGQPSQKDEMHIPTSKEMAVYRNRLLEYFDVSDVDKSITEMEKEISEQR